MAQSLGALRSGGDFLFWHGGIRALRAPDNISIQPHFGRGAHRSRRLGGARTVAWQSCARRARHIGFHVRDFRFSVLEAISQIFAGRHHRHGRVRVLGRCVSTGWLTDHFLPHLQINPELWNVPKFFVAFGMILSVLEEKSLIVEESGAREHAENALLLRFSKITSRLLSGSDPASLCSEIAEVITETVCFRRAAVMLAQEDGSLLLA